MSDGPHPTSMQATGAVARDVRSMRWLDLRMAALCVAPRSVYHALPEVDAYDLRRDVRSFAGGLPVVAHPPCRAWSAYCAHQAKPLPGEKDLGPLCVEWLRKEGGVLEHPAHSRLFAACGLPRPGETRGDLWTVGVWAVLVGGHAHQSNLALLRGRCAGRGGVPAGAARARGGPSALAGNEPHATLGNVPRDGCVAGGCGPA